ncbi:MAG TPA: glycosyltransferase family 1 protein [Chthoniobacterales bacterium]|nr:glycosyltransferase family 1 protein [Chthoniobacterales bacterium]
MSRFAMMILDGLTAAGVPAELIEPRPFFGRFRLGGRFIAKWLAYVDKFVLFPWRLRRRLRSAPAAVHICDHSNAMYARGIPGIPVVISCHDLLAVRGALGEQTDCPASLTGKLLQRWIVAGLRAATVVACVSKATLEDARRLVVRGDGKPKLDLIPLALSYPYRKLEADEAQLRLARFPLLKADTPFVLHVGSNLRRKNREGVLRIFAQCKGQWNGLLVFAGEPLSDPLRSLGRQLGVLDRVVEFPDATSELLETLYNCATAFLFPSRFEGFGWPIMEAQACGCPVICGDRAPLPEVAGDAGLIHPVEKEESFAAEIIRLTDPEERAKWSAKSLRNAQRFSPERMIAEYISAYRSSGARI